MALSGKVDHGIFCAELLPQTPSDQCFLLLHGLGGSFRFWTAVAPALGAAHRTLAIDLPGFGASEPPAGEMDLDAVAARIVEFCRLTGVANCTVAAHSLGGLVGMRVVAQAPELFRRLILIDATPITAVTILRRPITALRSPRLAVTIAAQFLGGLTPVRPATARWIARSKALRTLALWAFVAHPATLDPALTEQALSYTGGARVVLRALRQSGRVDLPAMLAEVRRPIYLVRGDRDEMNTAADFEVVRQHADVRRELVVPDCRHWPLIEAPDMLSEFILAEE